MAGEGAAVTSRHDMVQANQRIGEYVLDEKVGQGAFGEVWRAHHNMWTDQFAAVKIPTDPAYVRNLQSEGITIARLTHPNIARAIGFDPFASPPYLMTEFVPGTSLREVIAGKKLSTTDAVGVLTQILSGLKYAHEKGIVHGDIKPENILIDEAAAANGFTAVGAVKVTDFGVGLAANATATGRSSNLIQGSDRGTIGTAAYIAPEQRDGSAPDVKSDLFACGVVLFEMLTGERPAGTELPSEFNTDVPKFLDDAFRRSYARRDRRFGSAQEFLDALAAGSTPIKPAAKAGPAASAPASKPLPSATPKPSAPLPVEEDDEGPALGLREDDESDLHPAEEEEDDSPVDIAPAAPSHGSRVPPAKAAPPPRSPAQMARSLDDTGAEEAEEELIDAEAIEEVQPARPARSAGESSAPAAKAAVPQMLVPKQPSRAEGANVPAFDEKTNKPIRTAEEAKAVFRQFVPSRPLDKAETINVKLRLGKWAEAAGGDPEFPSQIDVTRAVACPYFRVEMGTRYAGAPDETVARRVLDNPEAKFDCTTALKDDDYRQFMHLSAKQFTPQLFDALPAPLKRALSDLLHESRKSAASKPVLRQDLYVSRANVIGVTYELDGVSHDVALAGNTLAVVAPNHPYTKMRDDVAKRAAMLLDSDQIYAGLRDLRRCFDTRYQTKALAMLTALRAKLSTAYLMEARDLSKSFGLYESQELSAKAQALTPNSQEVEDYNKRLGTWSNLLHVGPGLIIGLVFAVISYTSWHGAIAQGARGMAAVPLAFIAAGIGAIVAGLVSMQSLGRRMARTDLAFYHACVLPTAIVAVLATAPTRFEKLPGDLIAAGLLVAVIVADVVLFKTYRNVIFRRVSGVQLAGEPSDVVYGIEQMLGEDWERLQRHYKQLGPLYKFIGKRDAGEGHGEE